MSGYCSSRLTRSTSRSSHRSRSAPACVNARDDPATYPGFASSRPRDPFSAGSNQVELVHDEPELALVVRLCDVRVERSSRPPGVTHPHGRAIEHVTQPRARPQQNTSHTRVEKRVQEVTDLTLPPPCSQGPGTRQTRERDAPPR